MTVRQPHHPLRATRAHHVAAAAVALLVVIVLALALRPAAPGRFPMTGVGPRVGQRAPDLVLPVWWPIGLSVWARGWLKMIRQKICAPRGRGGAQVKGAHRRTH